MINKTRLKKLKSDKNQRQESDIPGGKNQTYLNVKKNTFTMQHRRNWSHINSTFADERREAINIDIQRSRKLLSRPNNDFTREPINTDPTCCLRDMKEEASKPMGSKRTPYPNQNHSEGGINLPRRTQMERQEPMTQIMMSRVRIQRCRRRDRNKSHNNKDIRQRPQGQDLNL